MPDTTEELSVSRRLSLDLLPPLETVFKDTRDSEVMVLRDGPAPLVAKVVPDQSPSVTELSGVRRRSRKRPPCMLRSVPSAVSVGFVIGAEIMDAVGRPLGETGIGGRPNEVSLS